MYRISEQALKDVQIKEDPHKFLDDIVKITCLIVKDGEEYRFIHKSVQEYYAASYIKQKPELIARKLYPMLFLPEQSQRYAQELSFLAEIDAYRFQKYGVISYLCKLFSITDNNLLEKPSQENVQIIRNAMSELLILFGKEQNAEEYKPIGFYNLYFGPLQPQSAIKYVHLSVSRLGGSAVPTFPHEERVINNPLAPMQRNDPNCGTLGALLKMKPDTEFEAKLDELSITITGELFEIGRKAVQSVGQVENDENVLALN